jgi:hypothetical protein
MNLQLKTSHSEKRPNLELSPYLGFTDSLG